MRFVLPASLLLALVACSTGSALVILETDGGPFCALDAGIVPTPPYADPCIVQCTAQHGYCQGPLPDGAGWGCCANPPLPDGAPNLSNDCITAACGRK